MRALSGRDMDVMNEHQIVRSLLLRIGRGLPATARLARAVAEWAQPHADWLVPGGVTAGEELAWDALLAGMSGERGRAVPARAAARGRTRCAA